MLNYEKDETITTQSEGALPYYSFWNRSRVVLVRYDSFTVWNLHAYCFLGISL